MGGEKSSYLSWNFPRSLMLGYRSKIFIPNVNVFNPGETEKKLLFLLILSKVKVGIRDPDPKSRNQKF